MNLFEAFKALDALNEDTFAISDDGIAKLDEFQKDDEATDTLDIIDADAETEDDLQDSYVGKVILDCGVCHSKIYKDKEEVELNDDQTLANVGEECPFCSTSDGFKVIGEVADYSANKSEDDVDTDVEEDEGDDSVEESLDVSPTEDDTKDDKSESSTGTLAEAVATLERPMSAMGGTLSNVMTAHKDELATISDRESAVSFLDSIEPEVKNKGYLATIKDKITKLPNNRISQFLYNIILKGDGMGTKMESVEDTESLDEFMDANINLDARGFGGKDNNVSVLGGKVPFGESADVEDELEEGIFGGNNYKDKDFLVYRGDGEDKVIAIGTMGGGNHNLYYYKKAHMKKNGTKESDYVTAAPTKLAIKKYKKSLKTADDVSNKLPFWVQQSTNADKEKYAQDYRNAEAQKEREAKARRDAERDRYRNRKEHNPDDDYTYIKGNGSGTYRYREELDEAAFSGGMAGDNSINGGKVGGMGASTQPDNKTYLNRIKAKNPKLVDIITIKAKDLKPNMMTQAGQIKTAEVKYSGYHSKDMMYVVHTNGWDYFKELDADMEVMADLENKSEPFTGNYRDLLKMGLQEAMNESVNNVNVETDDSIVNVSSDENGKVTVTTEPNTAESAAEGDEVIAPVSPETEDAIVNGTDEEPVEDGQEVDAQVDEFDEESFDEVSESYLKEVYDNVTSFLTESVKEHQNSLIVEGYITFNNGKRAKTSFVLEAKDCTKGGTYRFVGSNKHLTEDAKPYLLTGKLASGKFICESLKYDYSTGSDVVSGTVKRG